MDNSIEGEVKREIGKHRRVQIDRVDGRDVLLEIVDPHFPEDLVDRSVRGDNGRRPYAPRYELTIVRYDQSKPQGQRGNQHTHWIEERDLLVLCQRVVTRYRGEKDPESSQGRMKPILSEYKGGQDRDLGGVFVSRYLEVRFNGGLTKLGPVYEFEFVKQDGMEGQKGEVRPKKDGQTYFKDLIRVPAFEAEAFAMVVLTHIQGKRTSQIASERTARKRAIAALEAQLSHA